MLSLDSATWGQINHAYGPASDIPSLLQAVRNYPVKVDFQSEPYFTLWSSLFHQGDVYEASYAAVPHLLSIVESAPTAVAEELLHLVTMIETARLKDRGPELSEELEHPYLSAIRSIPSIVTRRSESDWTEGFARICAASLVVAQGKPELAEAILELSPDTIASLMKSILE
jgi:hypothetical protein